GRRLQEKQLAAQQPDTLCSLLRRLSQLSMRGGVREHANGAAVFGLRRLEAARDRDLASRATTTGVVAREGDSLGVGPADHDAAIAVDNDLLPVCDLQQVPSHTDDHRQAQAAGHDRRVRGDAPGGERDSFCLGRPLSDVRGTERGGDQNALGRLPSGPLRLGGRAPAHAASAARLARGTTPDRPPVARSSTTATPAATPGAALTPGMTLSCPARRPLRTRRIRLPWWPPFAELAGSTRSRWRLDPGGRPTARRGRKHGPCALAEGRS